MDAGAGVVAMLTSNETVGLMDMFGIVDLDIQFLDWLFSLEGVTIGDTPSRRTSNQGFGSGGADVGWYATFRRLQFVGRGTGKVMSDDSTRRFSHPAQNLTVSVLSKNSYSRRKVLVNLVVSFSHILITSFCIRCGLRGFKW